MRPQPGTLLVASVALTDGVFDQAVVLVVDADADGVLGVILNEVVELALPDVLPGWQGLVCEPRMMFRGGPVSVDGAICLARPINPAESPPGWRRVYGDIGLLHLDTPVEIVSGAYHELRIFAGYSGWAEGQLEAELAEGSWHTTQAQAEDVFTPDPDGLWRRVLRRQATQVAWFSTWPDDPQAN